MSRLSGVFLLWGADCLMNIDIVWNYRSFFASYSIPSKLVRENRALSFLLKIFVLEFVAWCGCKINWLWVGSPLEEIKYLFKFSFLCYLCRGNARRWVSPLDTQCLQNLAESGERGVLTLGSLCLPCEANLIEFWFVSKEKKN